MAATISESWKTEYMLILMAYIQSVNLNNYIIYILVKRLIFGPFVLILLLGASKMAAILRK